MSEFTVGVGFEDAELLQARGLSLHLCVPKHWDDAKIIRFASFCRIAGTTNGWQIHEEQGRVQCAKTPDKIHIVVVV